MKSVFFALALMLIGSFGFASFPIEVNECVGDDINSVNYTTELSFTFPNLDSLIKFDFNSFLSEAGVDDGECTVSVTVSVRGISATFSVTAGTCEEAGRGAVDAAVAFIRRVGELMQE